MRAGKLRHRIRLQEFATTVGPNTGYRDKAWTDVAPLWAEVAPLSGREFLAAAATQSSVTARVTIRHRAGVTNNHRILHGTTVYNIEAVLPDAESGKEHLTLMCSTGVNDG